jgi:serine/threonine-protein kinase RsbT
MGNRTTSASAHEVTAVEPVIRRVVAARTANPADIDDLVQDCLERLLVARDRLAPEAVLPYAVVVARNLVTSHAKSTMRHAAAVPRAFDGTEPERPGDALLDRETRDAMSAALARLSDQERRDVLAYYSEAPSQAGTAPSRGALRVRMARTRAKLRLEYLLAFRHIELPTPRCHGVLLAISAGDTRRQRELNAGQHLLDCEVCATLSEPLDRRSIALTAIAVPGGLAVWAAGKARAHPVHAAIAGGAGTAAAAAVAVALNLSPHHSVPGPAPASPTQAAAPAPAVISHLSIAGQAVPEAAARHSLVGLLRALRVQDGDRVWFTGVVVSDSPAYPALAGVTDGSAALLAGQGAHLAVSTTRISVRR